MKEAFLEVWIKTKKSGGPAWFLKPVTQINLVYGYKLLVLDSHCYYKYYGLVAWLFRNLQWLSVGCCLYSFYHIWRDANRLWQGHIQGVLKVAYLEKHYGKIIHHHFDNSLSKSTLTAHCLRPIFVSLLVYFFFFLSSSDFLPQVIKTSLEKHWKSQNTRLCPIFISAMWMYSFSPPGIFHLM